MAFKIVYFLIIFTFGFSIHASAEIHEKAAFVRDHHLWIKDGDSEIQITKDHFAYNPQWSKDGRFLGFLKGEEDGSNQHLFIYDTIEKETFQPVSMETTSFKWSPISNVIAFKDQGLLNVTKIKNGRPYGFENVALGVGSYEWYPDGQSFIASSTSNLLPTGWEPVSIYQIPVDAKLDTAKVKTLYTLPKMTDDFFAIDAEDFKWSADGKWVSFMATPTASWSMDSNTLCVLSSDGKVFQMVTKMLGFYDWFKWAPIKNQLAYISGEGRFFVENKNATVKDIPSTRKPTNFTPAGFVDLDIEWFSEDEIIVARAKENKEWKEGPVPTMYTAFYLINIKTGEQKQMTFPKDNEIDTAPQVIDSNVTWLRHSPNQNQYDVWMKPSIHGQERLWLQNVGTAPTFYEKIN
ncbi:TolB family protein [Ureibacillus manganicus]|uniref:Translocation protein TolB n=1 Tax=Ureibacillus manganicus DSM 26584 TaxID=1384049 RepID=A0A0A3IPF7_9BACL|nr:hypothetical protein [Ureibacillus manganicus]KGR76727.1 hypothetical protein CD29_16410 [Ureibacillus manganicus DSM 26584]